MRRRKPTPPYRSLFEERVAKDLCLKGEKVNYETEKLEYIKPATKHKYLVDFVLSNGIIIEVKGRLTMFDRAKMLFVRACNPKRDIRFVFQKASNPIRKGSKTTYADWAEKMGFLYSDKTIPKEWIDE